MDPMLNIAVRAARAAGDIIVRAMDRVDLLNITLKSRNDFVSEVDRQAEYEIINILQKAYPTHAILGEEYGEIGPESSEYVWVIDPLDGTTNFLHGFQQFADFSAAAGAGVGGWTIAGYRLALLFAGSVVLVGLALYAYADRIAMGIVGARELLPTEAPALHSTVATLAGIRGLRLADKITMTGTISPDGMQRATCAAIKLPSSRRDTPE